MIIACKSKELFAPVILSATQVVVEDSGPTTESETHRDLTYAIKTLGSSHRDYLLEGLNLDGATVGPSSEIDSSSFPLLKRAAGFTGSSVPIVTNSRASTRGPSLYFGNYLTSETLGGPVTHAPGSYAKFSYDAVTALAAAVPDNQIISLTHPHYRVNTGTFPHAALTGLVWSAMPNYGAPVSGRKFAAITRRHVVGCGHYGILHLPANNKLFFLTVDNQIVEMTIIEEFNMAWEGSQHDITVYVLSEDLPESITPLPVLGEWFFGMLSSTSTTRTHYPSSYGIMAYGNDGQFTPLAPIMYRSDQTSSYLWGDSYGLGFNPGNAHLPSGLTTDWSSHDLPELSSRTVGGKFYHALRSGDSGSPILGPIADGKWGFAAPGHSSTSNAFSGAMWNAILDIASTRAGIPTTYHVTVAPDPTL